MITQARLKELLDYEPETGVFRYRVDGNNQNSKAGMRAGWVSGSGRRYLKIDGQTYAEHRLVWFYHYGRFPERLLDHANCDPFDNRISNLREATVSQNQMNRGAKKTNKFGLKGVHWCNKRKKYIAQIQVNGKGKILGRFDTPEDAHAAYKEAAKQLHGEFAKW